MIGWFIVNIQSDLFWHRCLERQVFGTPRMYMLSPSKSIKGSNYGEFLKDKNVLLCTQLYKYAPNLESLLTQQYACVMCTLWSDNTFVFTRFHSVKNANTQLIWSSASNILLLASKIFFPTSQGVVGAGMNCRALHFQFTFQFNSQFTFDSWSHFT